MKPLDINTFVCSDIHIGTKDCKAKELLYTLKSYNFKTLVLNGDIFDLWALKRGGKINKDQVKLIRYILKLSYKIPIIYLKGNHEEGMEAFIGLKFGQIKFKKYWPYRDKKDRLNFFIHGDSFDPINNNHLWLAKLGSIGYDLILWLNTKVNNMRERFGMPYISISRFMKMAFKEAVMFLSKYDDMVLDFAKAKGYDIIHCGHSHNPIRKEIDGIQIFNSGDWVESLSYVIEDLDGNWAIKHFYH